jgi:hypothetical protein
MLHGPDTAVVVLDSAHELVGIDQAHFFCRDRLFPEPWLSYRGATGPPALLQAVISMVQGCLGPGKPKLSLQLLECFI